MNYTNYPAYAEKLISLTKNDKSSNTYRVLFALNTDVKGLSYSNLLRFSSAFNQSALSRTLNTCKEKNLISYNENTKLYMSNLYYDVRELSLEAYKWISKILNSRLIGADITIVRIAILLISKNKFSVSELSTKLEIKDKQVIDAINRLTEELGTRIISFDFPLVSANLLWF